MYESDQPSIPRSTPGSESAEEQWDYQPHSGVLLRYRNEDGSDFDEFKYLGYRDNRSRLAETAAYLNALESQVAALQSALDEHKRVNPELGYGYWTPDGKLSQGDGESTVMLYKVDELQSQIIQLEKRLDAAEKKAVCGEKFHMAETGAGFERTLTCTKDANHDGHHGAYSEHWYSWDRALSPIPPAAKEEAK